jgi:transcriptional regulator with XRE-family HTH domain
MPRSDILEVVKLSTSDRSDDHAGRPPADDASEAVARDGETGPAGLPALEVLGQRIRRLRVERRMTLKDVEKLSGLSATHLSEIERGRTSPTIGALIRIARSLQREPSYFVEPEERAEVAHHRREEMEEVAVAPGVTAEALTRGIPGGEICSYRLRFQAGPACALGLEPQTTPVDALLLVTRGSVEVELGERRVPLAEGDAVQAPLTVASRISTRAGEPAEVIAMLSRPLAEIV